MLSAKSVFVPLDNRVLNSEEVMMFWLDLVLVPVGCYINPSWLYVGKCFQTTWTWGFEVGMQCSAVNSLHVVQYKALQSAALKCNPLIVNCHYFSYWQPLSVPTSPTHSVHHSSDAVPLNWQPTQAVMAWMIQLPCRWMWLLADCSVCMCIERERQRGDTQREGEELKAAASDV